MVMAIIYLKCEEYDKAMDLVELALEQESMPTVKMLKYVKYFDPLRDNPRFISLMEKYKI